MNSSAMISSLEGLIGSPQGFFSRATTVDAKPRQRITLWLELMKTLLRSRGLRDATDWEIANQNDAVNAAGTALDASGGTVYGVLVDSIFDVSDEGLFVLVADVTGTLSAISADLGAFSNNSGQVLMALDPAASTTAPSYGTWIDPTGQVFDNAIFAMADGDEGTAPTALDVRVVIVYRSDTEVRAD